MILAGLSLAMVVVRCTGFEPNKGSMCLRHVEFHGISSVCLNPDWTPQTNTVKLDFSS